MLHISARHLHSGAIVCEWDGQEPICGDVTDDGAIDTVDLMSLLKHCVNPAGNPIAHECAGDIDGNGYINSLDVLLLTKHIADP
jgi:hypothetical protein